MNKLLSINKLILFACTSMYFGTGWSLILFSFPIATELTPDNYYMQFVPQVQAATKFFTYMTMVMMASSIVFAIGEWKTKVKWYPIIIFILVVLATMLTIYFIFEYNQQMEDGIKDPVLLQDILKNWMFLNKIRVSIWTLQWLTMAVYFYQTDTRQTRTYE
jgi:hypothetical protein